MARSTESAIEVIEVMDMDPRLSRLNLTMRLACLTVAAAFCAGWAVDGQSTSVQVPAPAARLPQTAALDWPEEDLSARMMDGAHRFVERQIVETRARSGRFWKYDSSSATAWNASV